VEGAKSNQIFGRLRLACCLHHARPVTIERSCERMQPIHEVTSVSLAHSLLHYHTAFNQLVASHRMRKMRQSLHNHLSPARPTPAMKIGHFFLFPFSVLLILHPS